MYNAFTLAIYNNLPNMGEKIKTWLLLPVMEVYIQYFYSEYNTKYHHNGWQG